MIDYEKIHPNLREHVKRYIDWGFSIVPAYKGVKAGTIKGVAWTEYTKRKPTHEEIEKWFSEDVDIKVITGKISDNLVIIDLDDEEKAMFLEELGVEEPGLNRLIRAGYKLLGLITFFTAGVQEVRAWTFKSGMKAPECAGIIHSDFEKGFIRAETVHYDDLIHCGSEAKAKELGKFRLEGKDYFAKDGDIFHFRFNI